MSFAEALVACINGAKIRIPSWDNGGYISFNKYHSQFLCLGQTGFPYIFFPDIMDRDDWEILE